MADEHFHAILCVGSFFECKRLAADSWSPIACKELWSRVRGWIASPSVGGLLETKSDRERDLDDVACANAMVLFEVMSSHFVLTLPLSLSGYFPELTFITRKTGRGLDCYLEIFEKGQLTFRRIDYPKTISSSDPPLIKTHGVFVRNQPKPHEVDR